MPVLETGGLVLFESQVIAECLDEVTLGNLHPGDPLERARHRGWIEFGSATLAAIGQFYNAPAVARLQIPINPVQNAPCRKTASGA